MAEEHFSFEARFHIRTSSWQKVVRVLVFVALMFLWLLVSGRILRLQAHLRVSVWILLLLILFLMFVCLFIYFRLDEKVFKAAAAREDPVQVEVRIEDDLLHIEYLDIDRDDGQGPHHESLDIRALDIIDLSIRFDGAVLDLCHGDPRLGEESFQTETWNLSRTNEGERSALLEGLDRYAASQLGTGGLKQPARQARLGGMKYRTEEFEGACAAAGLAELERDAGRREAIIDAHRSKKQAIRAKIDSQRVCVEQDRLVCYVGSCSPIYTDASTVPFCIRKIDGYEVRDEEVEIMGAFKEDRYYYIFDSETGGTDNKCSVEFVTSFSLYRVYTDEAEEELLACLDRLKQE